MKEKEIIIRELPDGKKEFDIPVTIDVGQTVTLIVDRGKGEEVNIEKD